MHYYFLSFLFLAGCLFGNPSSPAVIEGAAQFLKDKNLLTIQTESEKTILHWDQFSIAADETAHFLQPSSQAATLNRVLSAAPSEILGNLTSNGVLLLINPNGILVGPEGKIDVGGLIASTLDIENGAFLRGEDLLFTGNSSSAIENLGLICGGDEGVFLIGRHIVNKGDILAVTSETHFGAGSRVLLKSENKHIYIQPDLKGKEEGTGIEQLGSIDSGNVELRADGNLYDLAIRHTGKVNALAIEERGGDVFLVAQDGKVSIEGKTHLVAENRIEAIGSHVGLFQEACLETLCAGDIVIGGVPGREESALYVEVGPDVFINSNLSSFGDGGNVTVFGTDAAIFFGEIWAKGGKQGGNGGVVEVSGHQHLQFRGYVNTEAPWGSNGLLIIDPTDITISGAPTAGGGFTAGTFAGTLPTAMLNNVQLNAVLQTTDVLVTTASGFGSPGDIDLTAGTTLTIATTSHTLTLNADRDITMSSSLTMSDITGGTSTLNLTAGRDILLDNAIATSNVIVNMNATRDVVSQGGSNNSVTAQQCIINAGNDITIANEITFTGTGSASNVTLTAGVDFNHNEDMVINNLGTFSASAVSGNYHLDNIINCTSTDTVILSGGVDFINQGGTNTLIDSSFQNTDLFLNAGHDVTLNTQLDVNRFNSCTINAAHDFVLNNDFEPDNTKTITINAGRDILNTGGSADIIANNGTTLSFTAMGNFISTRPFTANNFKTVNITATTGSVSIGVNGTTLVPGANTTVTAGNNITLLTRFDNLTSGDITFSAANDVTIGPSTILARVGTRDGTIRVTTGNDLNVLAGVGTNDRSQIGFSNIAVNSDIDLTVGRDIHVIAGGNSNSVAIIGHGFATAGVYSGDIIINSVGRDVNIRGAAGAAGATKFAQIGHTRLTGGIASFTGDIRGSTVGSPASISGTLRIDGGDDSLSYAHFGHGGRDSNALETYSGNIRVRANAIELSGGTSTDCYANIGYFAVAQTGGANPIFITSPASVQVISDTTISMTTNTNGIVSIGGRILNTAPHLCIMDLDSVDIQTGGDLTMTSGTGLETDATIGAFCNFGTADTNLTMNIGGNLLINAGTGAEARIVNGRGTSASKNTTIQVSGDITPTVAGAFSAYIENPTGDLSVTAQGTITLPALTRIANVGATGGTLDVTGGSTLVLSGGAITNAGTGSSHVETTVGDFQVSDTSAVSSIGNLTATIARDLVVFDDANMTSIAGTVQATAGQDIILIGTASGAASISSAGSGSYIAGRDVSLRGGSAVGEGLISNVSGTLEVFAGEDIEVNTFGRIENLGAGSLTLVVDNRFPTPPGIGPGGFSLSTLGTIAAGGGPVRIFTAVRDQNLIMGTGNLNGATFTPGPLFVDSATEQWETYYPSTFGGAPFTIFYKNGLVVPLVVVLPTVADILALNPNAFVPFYELSYILEGYNQDPVFAWLYRLQVENEWCQEKGEEELCLPEVLEIKKLPPYIHRTAPIEF